MDKKHKLPHSLPWELLQRANRMIKRRNVIICALALVIVVQQVSMGGVAPIVF